jgi:hypothetical protein
MIAQIIDVLNVAAETLPVDTRHGWAQIVQGQPAVHVGGGDWQPVANDLNGSWSYVRINGQARVEPTDIGDPCSGVRVRLPFRLVALLDRSECAELPGLLVQTAGSIRQARKQFVQASGAYRVNMSSILWQIDDFATQEFQPLPIVPSYRVLVAIDIIMEVDAAEGCFEGCGELTDVVCAIIAKASNAKVVKCLGTERVNQICNTDCPATTVNGEESDTPTITVLQGGIEVGTLNPATGVVTIDECPEGCTDPYTIKWDVDGTEITILVDNDPCGGEAVLSCDTLIDAVVVEGAGTTEYNGLWFRDVGNDYNGKPAYLKTGLAGFAIVYAEGNWGVGYAFPSLDTVGYIDGLGSDVPYPWDVDPSEWQVIDAEAPAPTVRQATIADLCPCEPTPCEDATLTWDGEQLLTIPSGGTQDLDCNTLVNAAYAQDGGSVTGTYKPDGTLNSREVFRLDVSHNFEYTGTRWRLVKPGSDYDAALGSETKPWDADWTATPVTVTQATIGAYCDDCVPCDDANVEVNGTAFDTVAAGGTLDIPVVNTAATPVGTVTAGVDVVVPDATVQLRDSAGTNIGSADSYPSGTSSNKTAPDATVQLRDSAANNIGSPVAYLSNSSNNLTAPDGSFQVRDSAGNAIGSPVAVRSNQTGVTATAPDATAVVKNLNGTTLVTEAILSNASENIIAPIPFIMGWGAGDDTTLTWTVEDGQAGTYATYSQDGASGTITYNKNSAGFAALSGTITLAVGDTIAQRRTVFTAQGFSQWLP